MLKPQFGCNEKNVECHKVCLFNPWPKSILTKTMKCDNSDLKAVLPENRCNNFRQAIVPDAFWIFNLSRLSWQDVKSNRQDPPFSRLLKAGHTNFTESAAVQIKTGWGRVGLIMEIKISKISFKISESMPLEVRSCVVWAKHKKYTARSTNYKKYKMQKRKLLTCCSFLVSGGRWKRTRQVS